MCEHSVESSPEWVEIKQETIEELETIIYNILSIIQTNPGPYPKGLSLSFGDINKGSKSLVATYDDNGTTFKVRFQFNQNKVKIDSRGVSLEYIAQLRLEWQYILDDILDQEYLFEV